jgi:Asp-tRNA(Asn)/Glu-tRNA(Gln) amidotransferase A subunit family amidase
MTEDIAWASAAELSRLYSRMALSPVEVVDATLKRAENLQPHLNSFVLIDAEGARAAARASEARSLPFNLTGAPAASMPAGLTRAGLPVGLQIVGPARRDHLVLRAMRAYESAAGWRWPQSGVLDTLGRL